MNTTEANRKELVTRDSILMMLSDDENAAVSTSETKPELKDGDIYLDLDHLALGVQKASKGHVVMGTVLPKSAVHKDTWKKIMAALAN
jgi:hypothetical protein